MANDTEYKNYLFINSNINVDVLRLDRDTTISLDGTNKDGKDIYALTQEKSITADTILFNTFVSNGEYQIDGQYFDPESEESGATFYIYRKTPYQKYYDYICSLENGATTLRDYNIANNEYYHYLAATEVKTSSGIKYKIYQNENGAVFNIDSDSNGTIIGRRGDTLDAVQYLSSMIANKGDKEYFRITIDCFGYREKRKATLQQLAEKVAKSVLRTGRSQPLEPMNPYERRVIHSAISKIDGVSSRSVGDEPYRKIIISSVNGRRNNNDKRRGGGRKNFDRQHESKKIDLSTSFEKDYKRPKPEDTIEGGLYGKIEF